MLLRRLNIFLSFLFTGMGTFGFAQLDSAYIHTYGGTNNDYARQIICTKDSGYIVVGTTSSFGVALTDIYVIKTDRNAVREWSHLYGTPGIDWGFSIRQTFDDGFIVAGYTNTNASTGYDIYLLKIAADGAVQWSKTIGGTDWDFGYGIELAPDSGFVICGKSYSYSSGGSDVYVVKTDANGNILWQKNYGGAADESANAIIRDRFNRYAIVGETKSYGAGDSDLWLLVLDDNGDTVWTKTYGTPLFEAGYAIDTTFDGNYITNGTTNGYSPDSSSDMILIKTRASGNWMWTRIHGGANSDEEGRVVRQLPNGDIFDGGTTDGFGLGKTAYYMLRNDSMGNFQKGCAFGGTDYEEGYSVDVGKDGQIVFAGISDSYGCGLYDVYLIRIDTFVFDNDYVLGVQEFCDSTIGIEDPAAPYGFLSVYPNPATSSCTIATNYFRQNSSRADLIICDVTGAVVRTLQPSAFPVELSELDKLQPGIYFISLYHDGQLAATNKLMLY